MLPLFSDEKENEEVIKSIDSERLDVIRYGIDSEIIELIRNLKEEKNGDFNSELKSLLEESANIQIKEQILTFFSETEYKDADQAVITILETYDEDQPALLTAAVKYAAVSLKPETLEAAAEYMVSDNTTLAVAAIRTVGKSGNPDYYSLLQQYYEDDDFPESAKADIILALGDLKSAESVPFLISLLENDEEDSVIRRYSCDSLRKIGDPQAIEPLLKAYETDDVILRSYVIYALSGFEGKTIEEILIQGLRDSYVRVRLSAAQGLSDKKAANAVPILIYKVQKDPEPKVRNEALKALGNIGTKESFDFIREIVKNKKSNPALRLTAIYLAIDKDLDNSVKLLEELIAEEWDKPNSKLLDYIAKQLSIQTNGILKDIFARFLDHPSFTIKLYGLRGIKRNEFAGFHDKVKTLTEEGNHALVRKTALGILEKPE